MPGVNALYLPLIERDFDAIPGTAREFLAASSPEELWVATARFAVLAFAPSLHSKRALAACRAALELKEEAGERWPDLIVECARYAAESRPAWSEPPPLDPPAVEPGEAPGLRQSIEAGDRHAAERWLAANLADAPPVLLQSATGETLLLLDTALALLEPLGERARYPLLRTVVWDLVSGGDQEDASCPLEEAIAEASRERGAADRVSAVFVAEARSRLMGGERRAPPPVHQAAGGAPGGRVLEPYRLSRDFAQTLIAHAVAQRLPSAEARSLLEAVHDNLRHGESFSEWSLA